MVADDGLANPGVIDEVRVPAEGPVELVVHHQVPWDGSDHRQILLQEKLNRYLEHVLDGELTVEHPQARGRPWLVVVACAAGYGPPRRLRFAAPSRRLSIGRAH